jgi:hypothetical protein
VLALTRVELRDLSDKLMVFADDIEGTDAGVRLDMDKVRQDLRGEWRHDKDHYAPPPPPQAPPVRTHGPQPD